MLLPTPSQVCCGRYWENEGGHLCVQPPTIYIQCFQSQVCCIRPKFHAVPAFMKKKLRCSAACALELKTRLDGWFIGMLQVASSFFFDVSTLYILSKLFCIYIVILYFVCVSIVFLYMWFPSYKFNAPFFPDPFVYIYIVEIEFSETKMHGPFSEYWIVYTLVLAYWAGMPRSMRRRMMDPNSRRVRRQPLQPLNLRRSNQLRDLLKRR